MVNGDLLRQLFRSHSERDDAAFRAAAEAVIREERLKNHRLLADDLERLLIARNGRGGPHTKRRLAPQEVPTDRERGFPLLDIEVPDLEWSRLVVPDSTLRTLQRIAEQHHRRDLLTHSGLSPIGRILFYGPPGCGKTLAARVLAAQLGYPLALVRFDAVVSSYLGETAANLRRVFDFVSTGQWVVLFDEFDALGKDRDNPFEHGELKRVVNSLLQLMDAYHGESLLIAATNHEGLLDSAVWRRFDEVIRFNAPTAQERILLLRLFLRGFDTTDIPLKAAARSLRGGTGSDVERVAVDVARSAVLAGGDRIRRCDLEEALRSFTARRRIMNGGARESAGTPQATPQRPITSPE